MSDELNPRQEAFCRKYYAGSDEVRGNGTEAYLAAYDTDNRNAAAVGASRLLKRDKIRARIREIREEAAEDAKLRVSKWWEDVPQARQTLRWALTGNWPEEFEDDDQAKRSAVEAAQTVIERAYGSVQLQHEHRISGQAIVAVTAGPDQTPRMRNPSEENGGGGRELPSPGPEIRPIEEE